MLYFTNHGQPRLDDDGDDGADDGGYSHIFRLFPVVTTQDRPK